MNRRLIDDHGILGGFDGARLDASDTNTLILAVTDMNTKSEIDALVSALETIR